MVEVICENVAKFFQGDFTFCTAVQLINGNGANRGAINAKIIQVITKSTDRTAMKGLTFHVSV